MNINEPCFATIAHQESWEKVAAVFNTLRSRDLRRLSLDEVKEIVPWIPPRTVFRIRLRSHPRDIEVEGIHIETFIPPEKLTPGSLRENIERVRAAADCAARENVRIAALGGFTSIVLEGDTAMLSDSTPVKFTTGNTLTTAFIVKALEEACKVHGMDLPDLHLLIVGSTGDIGSACTRYFGGKIKKLLLCARNGVRLQKQSNYLNSIGESVSISTNLSDLITMADIIILAASTGPNQIQLKGLPAHTIVCDAGYPKNTVDEIDDDVGQRLFSGGMGQVLGGYDFTPDLRMAFYDFPIEFVGHGCALEGALLALEGRFESYSTGRGNISTASIEEIWSIAKSHGFILPPFFNSMGLWDRQSPSPNN